MSGKVVGWAMEQVTGSPTTKLVLVKLADNANEEGCCWPSKELIAEHSELSIRAVEKHLRVLEDLGLVRVERRTDGKVHLANRYFLSIPPVARRSKQAAHAHSDTGTAPQTVPHPDRQVTASRAAEVPHRVPAHIEEPSIEPSENRHSLAPAGASEVAVLAAPNADRWPEARSAFADTWPDGFPADGEADCRAEFLKITRTLGVDALIGCIRAHGAELMRRKAARTGLSGPFQYRQPRNWLKQGDWEGYVTAAVRETEAETEEAKALGRVQATLGPGLVKILKDVGVTVAEIARFEGVTFEDGPPPKFITARPFQTDRLRQRAQKLERELGEGLIIMESGTERRSA